MSDRIVFETERGRLQFAGWILLAQFDQVMKVSLAWRALRCPAINDRDVAGLLFDPLLKVWHLDRSQLDRRCWWFGRDREMAQTGQQLTTIRHRKPTFFELRINKLL